MSDTNVNGEGGFTKGQSGKKKKKKLKKWQKILLVVLIILVGVFVAGLIYVNGLLNKINKVDTSETSYVPASEESFEVDVEEGEEVPEDTIDASEITWDDVDINVMSDTNVSNILLIGQDARGEERARSDTMIICSINKTTNKITLVSIMRDMYVPIPGYSDNRINAAYQFGGMELLDQVIEESLGVVIDGNVEVNFENFINAFAQIGDIDIELTSAEANYLNNKYGYSLVEGMNSLNPDEALAYSRCRSVGNSDWERTNRQRKVLLAAFEKIKDEGLFSVLGIANDIFPYLTTDMSNSEILGYIYTVFSSGMDMGENYRLPVDGTYTNETLRKGMEVLVPDLNANSAYLQEYLYGTTAYE